MMKTLEEEEMELLQQVGCDIPEAVAEYTEIISSPQKDVPNIVTKRTVFDLRHEEEADKKIEKEHVKNISEGTSGMDNIQPFAESQAQSSYNLPTCLGVVEEHLHINHQSNILEKSQNVVTLPVQNINSSNQLCSDYSPTSISQETQLSYISRDTDNDDTLSYGSSPVNSNHISTNYSRQNSTSSSSKTSHCLPPCRICGEKASGFHYGVNTCEACKGFFRRSIKRVTQYKCVESNNSCVIEPGKRNICPKCRFDKCVKVGMSKSAIKTGRYTHEKRSQDIREVKKLETGSPDCVPAVISCQDMEESKDLAMILVDAQKDMYGPKFEYWINDDTIYELAQDYLRQHKAKTDIFGDLHKLPEDEFKNFYNTTGIDIDNRIELMSEIATTLENGVSKYINFVKNIPGFISLCLEDQAALIKVSRFEFWFIGYQRFVCPDLEVTTGGMKQCHHKTELAKVVGHEFVEELFEHSRKIQSLKLTCDDIAVLRSFLVVSPDRCTLKDRDAVEKIQWKLLMCMKYLFEVNHKPEERYLSKVLDRVASLRVLSEMNEKRAQSIKLEWPILKNHPLLVELMSG
ncbi:vitamin D3 receptor-like [Mytilus galloprovincialis]|uniref:vitamin D3 receptor-like n=1 Tax=Mytilus galloprovincialis TaxID=29158 RepID=UPI003F7C6024